MRRPHRTCLSAPAASMIAAGCVLAAFVVAAAALSQDLPQSSPRLTGPSDLMENDPAPPLAPPVTDDVRRLRNYPEPHPVIPTSIAGYQLSLNPNRCLDCTKSRVRGGRNEGVSTRR